MSRFKELVAAVVRSRVAVGSMAVLALSVPVWATTTEALPTGLTPTDMVTAATGEISGWLATGIPIIIGFTILAAFVKGMTRKGSRPVK